MAYVKIIYQNSPSTATPINAQNLNHMDDGIAENDRRLNELETAGVVNKFNNRTGNVTPEKNDYDISLIGATAGEDGYVPVWRNSGTEEDPNWGFEMEQQGGSGHKILDADGSEMAQEDALQFSDSFVFDDDVNGKTVIENIKEHSTKADYDNATEDGFHVIDDGEDAVIHPSSEDYVEVTASSDTMGSLISKLFLEVDWDKVTDYAYLTLSDTGVAYYLAGLDRIDRNNENAIFTRANVSSGGARVFYYYLASSGQYYIAKGATAEEDHSTDNVPDGTILTLHYGNKKAVVDLQTTANRCLMPDGETTVADIIECDKTTAGTYALKCTVDAQGNKTYSWA